MYTQYVFYICTQYVFYICVHNMSFIYVYTICLLYMCTPYVFYICVHNMFFKSCIPWCIAILLLYRLVLRLVKKFGISPSLKIQDHIILEGGLSGSFSDGHLFEEHLGTYACEAKKNTFLTLSRTDLPGTCMVPLMQMTQGEGRHVIIGRINHDAK